MGLLLAAGLAAGMVNAVAGGGSLITFPALIATGLSPLAANVTNSLAVSPGYLAASYGSRADLTGQGPRLRALLVTAALGSAAGCGLLLLAPPRAFELVVPFLVLGAAAALAFQNRLRRLVGHPAHLPPRRAAITLHTMTGLAAVYGGYFGAALGVILIATLALVIDERLARINALKNVCSLVVGLVTVVIFASFGPVEWLGVAVLVPGTMVGGYLGARFARRLPNAVLRAVIVTFATGVGLFLLADAFLR